jgi:O-antigen/teichoic acid export membrane protein
LVISAGQIFFKPGLLVHKKVFKVARVTFSAAVINILLNVLLLPRIGVKGAAIATLLSYVAWILMMAKESLAVLHFGLEFKAYAKYLLAGVAVVLLVSRIQVSAPIPSILIKGTVCLFMYAGILCIIHAQFRGLVRDGSKWLAGLGQPFGSTPPVVGATSKE